MASNSTNSSFQLQENHGEGATEAHRILENKIYLLKEQLEKERVESVKEKVQRNGENLQYQLSQVMLEDQSRNISLQNEENTGQLLSSRIEHPLCKFNGRLPRVLGEGNHNKNPDAPLVQSIKMLYTKRLPPYIFWTHLARNEKMTKDQSVVGKRKIYYDQHGGETLICSDDEGETKEQEEVECDFSESEDRFIRMVFEEHGLTEEVSSIVSKVVGATSSEIQERYKNIKEKDLHLGERESHIGICLDKSLSDALDDFDHHLCRKCMIFDCPMHGCSQQIMYPREKQSVWPEPEGDRKPCSDHCYIWFEDASISSKYSTLGSFQDKSITTPTTSEMDCHEDQNSNVASKSMGKQKVLCTDDGQKYVTDETDLNHLSSSMEGHVEEMSSVSNWKPLEKELYLKGIEMFGRNSCLISRNLLCGWKTCNEVARYMYAEASVAHGSMDENKKIGAQSNDNETPSRSRLLRRKGKAKKFKFSSKSAGHPTTSWKRISVGENEIYDQYSPCGCEGMCGKQCPCLLKPTCCEKYCGCSKLCRNRFGGCHCTKSQCRSRHCPCFAASRECDPDVCRNCWVSCGDGSLGESSHHGESQCENMMILLRKRQRILLARSDVTGWGAFLKNPANKNDFLGEYTGELVNQKEAESRGKLYDRVGLSFLFNLNDQNVLDAYRKGDKLKFANHSLKPNCYAKIMFVNGDHRVGIFAKERIEAGDELFYDYHYDCPQKHEWILELLGDDSEKKSDPTFSQGKAKKH